MTTYTLAQVRRLQRVTWELGSRAERAGDTINPYPEIEPATDTEPWCNHDPAALTDVIVLRCECGATVDPDTGDVIGAGETGPDAVALGLVPEPECQRCADHDPRDRRDHGHIPDRLSHPERP